MGINPMMLLQLKNAWTRFTANHPKFPLFWKSVWKNGISEGTVIEFKVTTPDGKELCSNLKVSNDDLELMEQMK